MNRFRKPPTNSSNDDGMCDRRGVIEGEKKTESGEAKSPEKQQEQGTIQQPTAQRDAYNQKQSCDSISRHREEVVGQEPSEMPVITIGAIAVTPGSGERRRSRGHIDDISLMPDEMDSSSLGPISMPACDDSTVLVEAELAHSSEEVTAENTRLRKENERLRCKLNELDKASSNKKVEKTGYRDPMSWEELLVNELVPVEAMSWEEMLLSQSIHHSRSESVQGRRRHERHETHRRVVGNKDKGTSIIEDKYGSRTYSYSGSLGSKLGSMFRK